MQRRISARFLGLWAFCQFIVSCPGQYLGPNMAPETVNPNGYGFGSGLVHSHGLGIQHLCADHMNLMGMLNPLPPAINTGYGNGMGLQGPSPTVVGCDQIGLGPNLGYTPGMPDNYYGVRVPTANYGGALGPVGSSPMDAGTFGTFGSSPKTLNYGHSPRTDLSYGEGWGIPNTDIFGAGMGGPSGGSPSYLAGPAAYGSPYPSAVAGFAPSFPLHQTVPGMNKHTSNNANSNVNVNSMRGGF